MDSLKNIWDGLNSDEKERVLGYVETAKNSWANLVTPGWALDRIFEVKRSGSKELSLFRERF